MGTAGGIIAVLLVVVSLGAFLLWSTGHLGDAGDFVRRVWPWHGSAEQLVVTPRLEEFFLQTALSESAWRKVEPRVIKWAPGDVGVVEDGPKSARSSRLLRQELRTFSQLAGATDFVLRDSGGDIIITYLPHREYVRRHGSAGPGGTYDFRTVDGVGRIMDVRLYVDASFANRRQVFVHLLAHAVGLVGQPRGSQYSASILSSAQRSSLSDLSPLDRQAIRLLYDPRLKMGTTREQFRAQCVAP